MPTNLEEGQREPRKKVSAHEIELIYAWVMEMYI